jgi:hypothetical protein
VDEREGEGERERERERERGRRERRLSHLIPASGPVIHSRSLPLCCDDLLVVGAEHWRHREGTRKERRARKGK